MSFAEIEEDGEYNNVKQMKKMTDEEEGGGELMQIDGDDFQISLPIELILEFLSRLPVKSLRRLSCTSKYFYNTIDKNSHFGTSHLINYSQKHPFLVLYVNCVTAELYRNIFNVWDVRNGNRRDVKVGSTLAYGGKGKFFGYCNGLICFTKVFSKTTFVIDVWNFTTNEVLRITPPVIFDKEDTGPTRGLGYTLVSCGFGFDSFNNEYKLVMIVITLKTRCRQGFVYTSGTKSSWQEINLPDQKKATSPQGTFTPYGGGGALFWKTSDPQMILQFDLHQDKFQYIRIPFESNEYPASTRLFEFKGFLGVAILLWKSNTTTTLDKVHLKIHKDNQVWVNETFDVSPCAIPYSANFRFITFSHQVLLYWMDTDTNRFHFFNLHSKCLKVVRELAVCIEEKRLPLRAKAGDCWLTSEVQNISSLRTLLPERAQKSDFATVHSMMTKGIEDVFLLQEPKPFGALVSFFPSKINQQYFFNDN